MVVRVAGEVGLVAEGVQMPVGSGLVQVGNTVSLVGQVVEVISGPEFGVGNVALMVSDALVVVGGVQVPSEIGTSTSIGSTRASGMGTEIGSGAAVVGSMSVHDVASVDLSSVHSSPVGSDTVVGVSPVQPLSGGPEMGVGGPGGSPSAFTGGSGSCGPVSGLREHGPFTSGVGTG